MDKAVNLLWTSGADSTFRLLELLLIHKRSVQPYYVIDRSRKSLQYELQAMEKIKSLLFEKNAQTKQLLLPTIFKELNEVKPFANISEQYKRLASIGHLGAQYEWLACFAEEMKIYDLELSITSGVYSDSYFRRFVKPFLNKVNQGTLYTYCLDVNPGNPDLTLFKYFRFPIIEWSKLEMRNIAKEHNFSDIMDHTWFCHSPYKNQPCGICNPCQIAIKEKMWKQIPLTGILRYFSQHKLKPLLKRVFPPKSQLILKSTR